MMSSVSGQVCWPSISTAAMPASSARSTQAAAPSPNSAEATICLGQEVEPESDRADFDCDQKHDAAGARLREARSDREAGDTAGAAKTENGDALDVGAKANAGGCTRFKTGRGNASR